MDDWYRVWILNGYSNNNSCNKIDSERKGVQEDCREKNETGE